MLPSTGIYASISANRIVPVLLDTLSMFIVTSLALAVLVAAIALPVVLVPVLLLLVSKTTVYKY